MKIRTKPIKMEAVQWIGTNQVEIYKFGGRHVQEVDMGKLFSIRTFERNIIVHVGDWIIKGVNGEFFSCSPDIFEKTYDVVDELRKDVIIQLNSPEGNLIKKAIERFSAVVNSLECECDSYNGHTCTIHSDRILAERAIKVLEPPSKTVICEHADLDEEGICDYTGELCRFKNVRNCKNFVEDDIG